MEDSAIIDLYWAREERAQRNGYKIRRLLPLHCP